MSVVCLILGNKFRNSRIWKSLYSAMVFGEIIDPQLCLQNNNNNLVLSLDKNRTAPLSHEEMDMLAKIEEANR